MRWQLLVLTLVPLAACGADRSELPGPDPDLLVANDSAVSLGGERLAGPTPDAWTKIEPLAAKLHERREKWNKEHPGESPPPGALTLDLGPTLSCRAALSVSMTAAWSGFEEITVKKGSTSVKLPHQAPLDPDRCTVALYEFAARFHANGEVDLALSSCGGAFDVAPSASLASMVKELCGKAEDCPARLHLSCDAEVPMAAVLSAISEVAKSHPAMRLGLAHPCSGDDASPFHPSLPEPPASSSAAPPTAPAGSPGKKSPPPKIEVGPVTVTGKLDAKEVEDALRPKLAEIQACYEAGLTEKPDLKGRAVVRLLVGKKGAVMQVGNGDSDLPDAGTLSCIVRSFYTGASFPAKGGLTTVLYPVSLSPR